MALSNAEKQARYRERLRAREQSDALREKSVQQQSQAEIEDSLRRRLAAGEIGHKVTITGDEYLWVMSCLLPEFQPDNRKEKFERAYQIMSRINGSIRSSMEEYGLGHIEPLVPKGYHK